MQKKVNEELLMLLILVLALLDTGALEAEAEATGIYIEDIWRRGLARLARLKFWKFWN